MLTISGSGISLPGGAEGVYDYYITDQQTNVRMILTEEMHSSFSTCSMENINLERALLEAGIFGQVNTDGSISPTLNEVEATRYPQIAVPGQIPVPGWQSNTMLQVSRLGNWAGHTVGPNQLLKVMAGDEISATAKYYFETPNNPSGQSENNFITGLLAMLAGTLTNSVLPAHGAETAISSQLQGAQPFTSLVTPASDPNHPLNPKAGLVMVFFDERFNYVGEGSFFDAVKTPGDNALLLGTDYLYTKAPKNGYCYIYVCNQSNENVYFDDLKVRHDRARIIEENHYYAYGLKIAAISSQKLADKSEGVIKNNFGYQGDYSEYDEDLGWNDFALRSYDPQLGRFINVDPYDQFASGYVGMGADPANNRDPNGGFVFAGMNQLWTTAFSATGGFILGAGAAYLTGHGKNALGWGLAGAAVGAGASLVNWGGAIDWVKRTEIFSGLSNQYWATWMSTISAPLDALKASGASEQKVRSAARRLSEQHQGDRWFKWFMPRGSHGSAQRGSLNGMGFGNGRNRKSGATGWRRRAFYYVDPYPAVTKTQMIASRNVTDPNNPGNALTNNQPHPTDLIVQPGSQVHADFFPKDLKDDLVLSVGDNNDIIGSTGLVGDMGLTGSVPLDANVTTAGVLKFQVNTPNPARSNWEISLKVTTPLKQITPLNALKQAEIYGQ